MNSSAIVVAIVACEVAFWVVLAIGLGMRYGLRRRTASTWILRSVPLVDLALLIAVAVDIHSGADVGQVHRLAGIYLGVTLGFGHSIIRWADVRVAHRFAGGPPPPPKPAGAAALRAQTTEFGRWLASAGVAIAVTAALAWTVANRSQAGDLWGTLPQLGVITAIWFVAGPVWAVFEFATGAVRRTNRTR